jgi:hypothetical protein
MNNEVQVIENLPAENSNYDVQVETAKKYPRDIKRAVNNMIAIATMDNETAKSCTYSLPRSGKNISGGSVHLAKIVAQNWGNLRVEAKVSKITATSIYSEAVAFDLESNVAIKVETTRKITKKTGERYNDDLIALTGLVTNSIALRNAVFAVVPKSVVDKVYNEAKQTLTGDLSDEAKLIKKRKQVIDGFKDTYGVSEAELLESLGLNTVNQIKSDEIVILIGMAQSLKDGEFTVETMFNRGEKPENIDIKDSTKKDK